MTAHVHRSDPSGERRRIRVLAITRIFPNRLEPLACPFQRRQFVALSDYVDLTVMACIPSFPGARRLAPRHRAGRLSRLPERDIIDGLSVIHPRIPYLPRVGPHVSAVNGPLFAAGLLPYRSELKDSFDLILGAFLFPDAWAAGKMAEWLGIPYVVKAHGTDANVTARSPWIAPLIRNTLQKAQAVVAVSRPMVDSLIALGASPHLVHHVPNGVDRNVFAPRNKKEARENLGWSPHNKRLLFVGRLEREKGLFELLEAYRQLRSIADEPISLVIVGEGSLQNRLAERTRDMPDVVFAGARRPDEIASFLAAADLLVLPSWAEGTPNVVLEALAAGRPVVASHVGGIPDLVCQGKTGLLIPPNDVPALVNALQTALDHPWDENEIVQTAPPDWKHSGARLFGVLQAVLDASQHKSVNA